jgi:hypothetical protein
MLKVIVVAAKVFVFPAWAAAMVQVPARTMLTTPPGVVTVQTDGELLV